MNTKMFAVVALACCTSIPAFAQIGISFGGGQYGSTRTVYFGGQGSSTQFSNHHYHKVRPVGFDRNTWDHDYSPEPDRRIGRTVKKIEWEERTRMVYQEEERLVPHRMMLPNGQTKIVMETRMVKVPREVTYRVPVEVEVSIGMPTPGGYDNYEHHHHYHNDYGQNNGWRRVGP